MTLQTFLLIAHLVTALSAILAFVSFYKFSERQSYIKLVGLLLLVSFICNLTTYLFGVFKITWQHNLPASIYDFSLIVIVSILYKNQTKTEYSGYFMVIAVLYLLFALLNLLFIQKEAINSYNKLLGSFIIIGYAIFYFYRLMVELPTSQVHRLPMFWFNAAFLIFHAGAIFLFAFTSYLVDVLKDNLLIYWSFHNALGIIQRLIILVGLTYDLKSLRKK